MDTWRQIHGQGKQDALHRRCNQIHLCIQIISQCHFSKFTRNTLKLTITTFVYDGNLLGYNEYITTVLSQLAFRHSINQSIISLLTMTYDKSHMLTLKTELQYKKSQ